MYRELQGGEERRVRNRQLRCAPLLPPQCKDLLLGKMGRGREGPIDYPTIIINCYQKYKKEHEMNHSE